MGSSLSSTIFPGVVSRRAIRRCTSWSFAGKRAGGSARPSFYALYLEIFEQHLRELSPSVQAIGLYFRTAWKALLEAVRNPGRPQVRGGMLRADHLPGGFEDRKVDNSFKGF